MTVRKRTAWQASLSIAGKTNWGCISFRSRGAAICPLPSRSAPPPRGSSSGSSNGCSTIKGRKRYLSARHGWNGERLHFLAITQTNQLALEGARVLRTGLLLRGDRRSEKRAAGGMTSAASNFLPNLTAACAVPGRHSCDAAAVRSFTLSMHSFTLSCCGHRLSPWTTPHDLEIFRNDSFKK
jgi:hypothetical protein